MNGWALNQLKTVNCSAQPELSTLVKVETEGSPNPEQREWNKEPAVIYQIETDIRTSKKDGSLTGQLAHRLQG